MMHPSKGLRGAVVGFVLIAFSLTGCGPAGVTTGIAALADDGGGDNVFIFTIVNADDFPLIFRLDGLPSANGDLVVAPNTEARVPLNVVNGDRVRVRAHEIVGPGTGSPVAWDYDFTAQQGAASATFSVQSQIVATTDATTSSGSEVAEIGLERLSRSSLNFESLASTALDFDPLATVIDASGLYLYALESDGPTSATLRAFRVNSETGDVESIAAPIGSNALPVSFRDEAGLVASPSGSHLYIFSASTVPFRSELTAFTIQADGSLVVGSTFDRGRIGSLTFDPTGTNAYVGEDLGSGYQITGFRIDPTSGSFDFPLNSTPAPCGGSNEIPVLEFSPSGEFAIGRTPLTTTSTVSITGYVVFQDGNIYSSGQCLTIQQEDDIAFSPDGNFVYVSGRATSTQAGLLTYSVEPTSGQLTAHPTQFTSSAVGRVTAELDPATSSSDPLQEVVYVSLDGTTRPYTVQSDGTLQRVERPDGSSPSLSVGSISSTRNLRSIVRGRVNHEIP